MKSEEKIIASIGIYGCLILSTITKGEIISWLWFGLAIFWSGRYLYFAVKK